MAEDTVEKKRREVRESLERARTQAQRKDPSPDFAEKIKKQQERYEKR